jgi:3D (Asp-Asp-Asp) domain-containing protein
MVARTLTSRLAACTLVLVGLLVSFSEPATDGTALRIAPEVRVLAAARAEPAARPRIGPTSSLVYSLKATAYNSLPGQTWGDPHITATGATTAFGILAASRDLLGEHLPYGSLVRLRDLGGFNDGRGTGTFQEILDEQQLFIVEDTMHARKTQQVDVWFPELATALSWGVRRLEVEVVRFGRSGPELGEAAQVLNVHPRFTVPGSHWNTFAIR